jgi:hypothetical protein
VTKPHDRLNLFFAGFFAVDDGNVTNHKKSLSLVPRPAGNHMIAGGIILDRDPCRVAVNIRSLCRVDPVFPGDLW